MQHLKQGATLQGGKYKIVKVLGQGSFGITYLATTKVALTGGLGNMEVTVNVAIKELIKHCYWHFTFKGDVCGFLITGPNGNCIFLPASGWFHGSLIYQQDAFGFYMSSSSLESGASRIYHGCFRSDKQNVSLQYRYYGFSVRPVID